MESEQTVHFIQRKIEIQAVKRKAEVIGREREEEKNDFLGIRQKQ